MFRRDFLQHAFLAVLMLLIGSVEVVAQAPLLDGSEAVRRPVAVPVDGDFSKIPLDKIPPNTLIVKGAQPIASDRSTPLPESGFVSKDVYKNHYLGLNYPLAADWTEAYKGPPPSDSGSYVLAQLVPSPSFKRSVKGTVLITAQDMFFARTPAHDALELMKFNHEHLPSYYEVEQPPTELAIAGHKFIRFDYKSSAADLHWFVLATQIRCHTVQFIFNSRDPKLLEDLIADMSRMEFSSDAAPQCIAGYASKAIEKVDPVLTDHRFNQIPVRIIIGKNGRVRHVHLISAFEDQGETITDALLQWRFPSQPFEVETGILFRGTAAKEEGKKTSSTSVD